MNYEWDVLKRQANLAKHAIDFLLVEKFDWETAQIERYSRFEYGEDRFKVIGWIEKRLYVLVFTKRSIMIRIIGLRKANQKEVAKYEKTKT